MSFKKIEEQALKLSEEERVALAQKLLIRIVFTLKNLHRFVEHTRLKEFKTKPRPSR